MYLQEIDFVSFPYGNVIAVHFWKILQTSKVLDATRKRIRAGLAMNRQLCVAQTAKSFGIAREIANERIGMGIWAQVYLTRASAPNCKRSRFSSDD
jgi:hypothetical protein